MTVVSGEQLLDAVGQVSWQRGETGETRMCL